MSTPESSGIVTKFEKLDDDIKDATKQLQYACSTLRVIYNKDPTGEFAIVFGRTVKHSKVYSRKILEIANVIVQNIKFCLEGFVDTDFEEFKDNIDYFVEEASGKDIEVEFASKLHEEILADFKREEDNLVKFLSGQRIDEKYHEEVDNKNDGELATNMSSYVRELGDSIKSFVGALKIIAGFFATLESDLNILATTGGKHSPLIFKRFKNKVMGIIKSCDAYTAATPDLKTELQAIPENPDEEDYIEGWFSEKKVRINSRQMSLLEYGRETFSKNKKVLRFLSNA